MWSQKPITVDRQQNKGPIFLPRPFLAVVGAIQPGVLPEVTANRDDGMLDRFLLAYPDPVPDHWSDEEISVEAEVGVGRVYARLHDLPAGEDDQGDPKPVPVDLSPEARDIFKAQVNALGREKREPGFPETLQGPWGKMGAQLARLALARAVEEDAPERVEVTDLERAVKLLDYFKAHARRVYLGLQGEKREDRLAADVAAFLRESGNRWEDPAQKLYVALRERGCEVLPEREDELSKQLLAIAARTPALEVECGKRDDGRDEEGKRRIVRVLRIRLLELGETATPAVAPPPTASTVSTASTAATVVPASPRGSEDPDDDPDGPEDDPGGAAEREEDGGGSEASTDTAATSGEDVLAGDGPFAAGAAEEGGSSDASEEGRLAEVAVAVARFFEQEPEVAAYGGAGSPARTARALRKRGYTESVPSPFSVVDAFEELGVVQQEYRTSDDGLSCPWPQQVACVWTPEDLGRELLWEASVGAWEGETDRRSKAHERRSRDAEDGLSAQESVRFAGAQNGSGHATEAEAMKGRRCLSTKSSFQNPVVCRSVSEKRTVFSEYFAAQYHVTVCSNTLSSGFEMSSNCTNRQRPEGSLPRAAPRADEETARAGRRLRRHHPQLGVPLGHQQGAEGESRHCPNCVGPPEGGSSSRP